MHNYCVLLMGRCWAAKVKKGLVMQKIGMPLSKEYEISSAIVSSMWRTIGHTQGILLTQIEAVLGDTLQAKAFKSLVKRELNTMGGFVQNAIYEEWKVQEPGIGALSEAPLILSEEE